MTGGLINLVSYGFDDLYLTGAPQITFFKIVYRRHTNFSKESIIVPIGEISFNDEIQVTIPKTGDLLSNTYLQLNIPEINFLKTDTASDLTTAEYKLLSNPQEIDMSDSEKQAVSDYKKVIIPFISINSLGYRVAVENKDIKNQNTKTYVTSILNVLKFGTLEQNYSGSLNNAYVNVTGENVKFAYILNPSASNINLILNNIIVIPDAYNSYTVSQVFELVQTAIDACVDVKNFFFSLVKKHKQLVKDATSKYAKFAWVERLGHAIIDRIDVFIGGERIDRHYGDWINIWYELTSDVHQDDLYNVMIGNVLSMTAFDRIAKPAYSLYIPLSFWFCRKFGLAFPLIALQYSTISLNIKLTSIDSCAYVEILPDLDLNQLALGDIWDNLGLTINASLLVEYIYLDSLERKRFAQSAHEYLIETVDQMSLTNLSNNDQSISLDFQGPSKEIIWYVQKMAYNQTIINLKKMPFNYSMTGDYKGNGIINSKLILNGYTRFDKFNNAYFNFLQPNARHTRTPSDGVNLYSFCLFPEEHQPSATCNFSRIGNPTLVLNINEKMFFYNSSDVNPKIIPGSSEDTILSTNVTFIIYSVRYNVLRIIGGNAGFAFSY